MKNKQVVIDSSLDELEQDIELKKFYQQEKLILDLTELVSKLMKEKKINKTKLAELLGVGKSYITQLLDGTTNMTLRTISDVFFVLDSMLVVNTSSLSFESGYGFKYECESSVSIGGGYSLPVELTETNWVSKKPLRMVA